MKPSNIERDGSGETIRIVKADCDPIMIVHDGGWEIESLDHDTVLITLKPTAAQLLVNELITHAMNTEHPRQNGAAAEPLTERMLSTGGGSGGFSLSRAHCLAIILGLSLALWAGTTALLFYLGVLP